MLKYAAKNLILNKIKICFNSLSALKSLQSEYSDYFLVKRIKVLLQSIPGLQIIFIWVPTQIGIKEKEKIDELAKVATQIRTLIELEYSLSKIKCLISMATTTKKKRLASNY